MWTAL